MRVFPRISEAMKERTLLAFVAMGGLALPVPAHADPGETAQTVARCRVDATECKQSIGMGVVLGDAGKCPPNDMVMPTDAEIKAILSWLEQHPRVEPDDFVAASNAAIDALYPCPN